MGENTCYTPHSSGFCHGLQFRFYLSYFVEFIHICLVVTFHFLSLSFPTLSLSTPVINLFISACVFKSVCFVCFQLLLCSCPLCSLLSSQWLLVCPRLLCFSLFHLRLSFSCLLLLAFWAYFYFWFFYLHLHLGPHHYLIYSSISQKYTQIHFTIILDKEKHKTAKIEKLKLENCLHFLSLFPCLLQRVVEVTI